MKYSYKAAVDLTGYRQKSHKKEHYVVSGGVQIVQSRLSKDLDTQVGAYVRSVEPIHSDSEIIVRVTWTLADKDKLLTYPGQEHHETLDYAVLAVSPDVAQAVLRPLARQMLCITIITVYFRVPILNRRPDHADELDKYNPRQVEVIRFISNKEATESFHEHTTAGVGVHTSSFLRLPHKENRPFTKLASHVCYEHLNHGA